MMHESIRELETTLKLIQPQADGFTYRNKAYRLDHNQVQQYGKRFAEIQALTTLLYNEAYALRRSAAGASLKMPEATPEYQQQTHLFTEQLSAHNYTQARKDAGWTVTTAYPQGQINVQKQGVNIWLQPGEYELPEGTTQAVANMTVSRVWPKENRTWQSAFYYVNSESGFDHQPAIVRIYWNIEPNGAAALIKSVTQTLNLYRIPFLFKCLNHPALYNRRDAAVLYIQKRYLNMLEALLPLVIDSVKTHLQDDVPLFTYKLAPGVGFAESPVNGDSFGIVRMRMVASGLVNAFDKRYTKQEQQLSEIAAALAVQGIKPEAPYLNEGSVFTSKPMNLQ